MIYAVIYLCVRGIDFVSFSDFYIGFLYSVAYLLAVSVNELILE